MPIHMVILSSDLLFWLLLLGMGGSVLWLRRQEMMLRPWRQILASPVAVACLMVLLTYIGIAFLDSIHFRHAASGTQVYTTQSVLDWLLAPIADAHEKTYSSPFASTLYMQTVYKNAAGETVRGFAPLTHVYQATSSLDQTWHIMSRAFMGALLAAVIMIVPITLTLWVIAKTKSLSLRAYWHSLRSGQSRFAVHSCLFTVLVLAMLIGALLGLARQYHIFGTDKIGGDVFYETLKSIRTGVLIGSLTTVFMLPFALLLGMLAGYFGGWIDDVIQFVYTVLSSIPGVLLISAAILALQLFINQNPDMFPTLLARADARLLALCAILGIMSWTGLCRLLRAETFKLRELDFVTAAKSLGVRQSRILLRHILPNIFHIIIITIVIDFSGLVLAEAVLSYVGVGVDPTMMSWGNMINSARLELAREPIVWWPLIAAMIFMFVLVLALNLFADKVRDAFDPRMNA